MTVYLILETSRAREKKPIAKTSRFRIFMEHLVAERIPVQRRLPSPMPLDRFNAPAGRQGQEAERLYQAEFGHENLGRLLDELLFRQDVVSDHGVTFPSPDTAGQAYCKQASRSYGSSSG